MRMRRCALLTSKISANSRSREVRDGRHRRRPVIVGLADLFGRWVCAVTPETLLSTTRRGSRSGALTRPSLPTADPLYCRFKAERPPGTSAIQPSETSACSSRSTVAGSDKAEPQEDSQCTKSISGSGAGGAGNRDGHAHPRPEGPPKPGGQ